MKDEAEEIEWAKKSMDEDTEERGEGERREEGEAQLQRGERRGEGEKGGQGRPA